MSDLHDEIMRIPVPIDIEYDLLANKVEAYKIGHRDARHAAAEMAAGADLEPLLAENEALREEIELDNKIITERNRLLGLFECLDHGHCVPYAMEQVAELRRDAERYRWLRQYEFDIGSYHGVHEHNAAAWFEHISDEAIDTAIAEEAQFAKEFDHQQGA